MSYYRNNEAVLRRCQLARDHSEPPEYWEECIDDSTEPESPVDCSTHHWNCVCENCLEEKGGTTMITFTPENPAQVVKEKVVVDGKEIGTVFPYVSALASEGDKFQVQLCLANCQFAGGFGQTKEEAIKNAIENGVKTATTMLAELAEIEAKI